MDQRPSSKMDQPIATHTQPHNHTQGHKHNRTQADTHNHTQAPSNNHTQGHAHNHIEGHSQKDLATKLESQHSKAPSRQPFDVRQGFWLTEAQKIIIQHKLPKLYSLIAVPHSSRLFSNSKLLQQESIQFSRSRRGRPEGSQNRKVHESPANSRRSLRISNQKRSSECQKQEGPSQSSEDNQQLYSVSCAKQLEFSRSVSKLERKESSLEVEQSKTERQIETTRKLEEASQRRQERRYKQEESEQSRQKGSKTKVAVKKEKTNHKQKTKHNKQTQQPLEIPQEQPLQQPLHHPLQKPIEQPLVKTSEGPLGKSKKQALEKPLQQPLKKPIEQPLEQKPVIPGQPKSVADIISNNAEECIPQHDQKEQSQLPPLKQLDEGWQKPEVDECFNLLQPNQPHRKEEGEEPSQKANLSSQLQLLKKLQAHESALPFLAPVDEERDGAPNYYAIISEPIDMQTISFKIVNNIYQEPSEFHADMQKMWRNARVYNKANPVMLRITAALEKYYCRLANIPLLREPRKKKGSKKAPLA